ncbi:hypothetical protein SPRG_06517 [Saprolegnia parasitica CBS 223.65]|uniref:Uncharacterized protein n=1 Tax=Saprolegnia parasitica (strain CBS 223.65) TaxID=695850 RepID=A0A067CPD9_SAPPC|nr:hypothetical protein SPRG_06517 [Saprolegnia parasitica CBS 223.65]KDO28662.1 hypothetical protein SPRG_06517 [Saprolegnia parasitica CBS 223.65]|eukprot:XP_012200722.1 hypothetical protein SPRG_06517 [Saprolegnia parasitica CBS 223.65]
MAATFRSVVLGQHEIAAIVFAFQFGLYEDVRPAFRACHQLVEFVGNEYECDVSFHTAFAPDAAPEGGYTLFRASYYNLRPRQRDARFPLHVAIAEGCVQLTKRMLRCRPDLASRDAIILAFMKNRLEIVELLLDEREKVPELHQGDDIARTNTTTAERDLRHPSNFLSEMLVRADTRGVDLLQHFGPRPTDFGTVSKMLAIARATLENATLALNVFPWLTYPRLLDYVAARGFVPLVQSLHERGLECSTDAMNAAAAHGHLDVVRFLHLHRREGCTTNAMDMAAALGHVEVVQFLHVNRTEGCTSYALDCATRNGHLDVVRFLVENRAEGASPNILNDAAGNGHLDVVQYLHTLGSFGCTVAAVDDAAKNGHLEVVTFLLTNRSEGCSRDVVVRNALKSGHLRTAEYLLSLGYPLPTSVFVTGKKNLRKPEMVGVVQLLLAHGVPCDQHWIVQASAVNNVPLVRFLHAHTDPSAHPYAISVAIRGKAWDVAALSCGAVDVVSRMLQRQPELRHDNLLDLAVPNHNTDALQYLLTAGIGKPRACLVKIAGRRRHWTASKLVLPYCMDASNHLDNVLFLLKLYEESADRARTLELIKPALACHARKASQTVEFASSVAARATTLLQTDGVVDGALALVISHLCATDTDVTTARLTSLVDLVVDDELQTQLHRLPEIAVLVFEFQFGVCGDVRQALRACDALVEYDRSSYVSFPTVIAPHAAWEGSTRSFGAPGYWLCNCQRGARHVPIYEGFARLAKRLVLHSLATEGAMVVFALLENRCAVVKFEMEQRTNVSGLRRGVHTQKRTSLHANHAEGAILCALLHPCHR